MFPVPSHLPRSAQDGSQDHITRPEAVGSDIALDLLSPFFDESPQAGPSRWTASQATEVRQKLENAVKQNKAKSHDLLITYFATVSSHIKLAATLSKDYDGISSRLQHLQGQIDPNNPRISFLPPVISQLDHHFTALNRRIRAAAHVRALKALQRQAEHVEKLEQAIWSGRGADGWVVDALQQAQEGEIGEEIKGTKISAALSTRLQMFRSMLLEQVTGALNQAVSLTSLTGDSSASLRVQRNVTLQKPKIPRHEDRDRPPSSSTEPPTFYSLTHIYDTSSQLGVLQPRLQSLATRIKRDLVAPLLEFGSNYRIGPRSQPDEDEQELCLVSGPSKSTPSEIIFSLKNLLDFLGDTVFPSDAQIAERDPFLVDLTTTTLFSLLRDVLIPSMPSTLSDIPAWLFILEEAASLESSSNLSQDQWVIRPFIDNQAGQEWAKSRCRQAAEDVKRLVLDGWGGWDAKEVKREKEVVVMVEVGVDLPLEQSQRVEGEAEGRELTEKEEDGDGWGFDSPVQEKAELRPTSERPLPPQTKSQEVEEEPDAWGFDDNPTPAHAATASTIVSKAKEEGDDGWDFDLIPDEPKPASQPLKPVKPVREAKKLGKKVAKARQAEEDDPMSSQDDDIKAGAGHSGWGWEEPVPDVAEASTPQRSAKLDIPINNAPAPQKETVLREEKRVVEETYLVSKACDSLLEIVERYLSESKDLSTSSLPTAFTSSSPSLLAAAGEVLDIFRALILTTQSSALKDVPTIAMQLSNDFTYISSRLPALFASSTSSAHAVPTPTSEWDHADRQRRLEAASEHIFEMQLSVQREGLMSLLDEAQGFEGTGLAQGSKRCEKVMEGVQHNLDSLSRVLKVVLPQSNYLVVMGYLIDVVVQRISEEVLALQDITEVESEKLDELLRRLHPLEEVFKRMDPPTSIIPHVPHWLKYQYLSELLHANLVDITYLFDSGALVDFTTQELVSIVKALFADSEKRDKAIERIEVGPREQKGRGDD